MLESGQGVGMSFLPILLELAIGIAIVIGLLLVSNIFGPKKWNSAKVDTYECGVLLHQKDICPFNVKFYLVAILFLVFDIEVVFLYPWAIIFKELGIFGVIEVFIFLVILVVGFIYAIKQGVLEWN